MRGNLIGVNKVHIENFTIHIATESQGERHIFCIYHGYDIIPIIFLDINSTRLPKTDYFYAANLGLIYKRASPTTFDRYINLNDYEPTGGLPVMSRNLSKLRLMPAKHYKYNPRTHCDELVDERIQPKVTNKLDALLEEKLPMRSRHYWDKGVELISWMIDSEKIGETELAELIFDKWEVLYSRKIN